MKKLMTVLGAAAMSMSLFADGAEIKAGSIGFEKGEPGVTLNQELDYTLANFNWSKTGEAAGQTMVKAYDTASQVLGSQYLYIETEGGPVKRSFASNNAPVDFWSDASVSTYVQFTMTAAAPDLDADAKFAFWLQENSGAPNLMVSCGVIGADGRTTKTVNIALDATIEPNSWHKVTTKPVYEAGKGAGFLIYLDDAESPLAVRDDETLVDSTWAQGFSSFIQGLIAGKQFLPSRVDISAAAGTQLVSIGFEGAGAIDNVNVLGQDPFPTGVAEIKGLGEFASLAAAVDAAGSGDTIKLLADCMGDGIIINKSITIDFNGKTYTADGDVLAGSAGTKSQAFQLLKGNTITFKNGTIYSEKARMLVQNYANLTLDNMVLDGSKLSALNGKGNAYTAYTLSNCNGAANLKNGTKIVARTLAPSFAFDVDGQGGTTGYTGITVSIDSADVVITGDYELGREESPRILRKVEGHALAAVEGYEWTADEVAGYVVLTKIIITPVDPNSPIVVPAGKTAEAFAKEINDAGVGKYLNVPTGIDTAKYTAMFEAKADGKGAVVIDLKPEVEVVIKEELANTDTSSSMLAPTEQGEVTITARPGLFYGIKAVGDVTKIDAADGQNWEQAKAATVTVKRPVVEGDAAFFQAVCSPKNPESNAQ